MSGLHPWVGSALSTEPSHLFPKMPFVLIKFLYLSPGPVRDSQFQTTASPGPELLPASRDPFGCTGHGVFCPLSSVAPRAFKAPELRVHPSLFGAPVTFSVHICHLPQDLWRGFHRRRGKKKGLTLWNPGTLKCLNRALDFNSAKVANRGCGVKRFPVI